MKHMYEIELRTYHGKRFMSVYWNEQSYPEKDATEKDDMRSGIELSILHITEDFKRISTWEDNMSSSYDIKVTFKDDVAIRDILSIYSKIENILR